VSVGILGRLFRCGDTVLEIGCGTGIETIPLARIGVNVVALDISEEMLRILEGKVAAEPTLPGTVRTRALPSSDISDLKDDTLSPKGGFDGAFSNFGAMNLEGNLEKFARELANLLKPDSAAVFGVWNRVCLSEILAKFFTAKTEKVRERLAGCVRADDQSRYSLDTHTYTPREFAGYFKHYFRMESYFAVPAIAVPPPDYANRMGALMRLKNVDYAIGRVPLLRSLGENFLMTLRRRR
jgi:SAM-dependent methyltransferase